MYMWWVMCTCITSGVPIMRHMYRLTSHVYRVMSLVTFGIWRDITRCTTSHVESHVMRHVCTDSASCESSHVTRGIRNAAEHDSFYYVTRRVICSASRVQTMRLVYQVKETWPCHTCACVMWIESCVSYVMRHVCIDNGSCVSSHVTCDIRNLAGFCGTQLVLLVPHVVSFVMRLCVHRQWVVCIKSCHMWHLEFTFKLAWRTFGIQWHDPLHMTHSLVIHELLLPWECVKCNG